MKKLISVLILMASFCQADELYLEVNDNLARVSVTNIEEAVTILPEVIAEIEATNYTACVHKHSHNGTKDKPCEVTPLASEEDVVIVEEKLTEAQSRTKLPEYLAMPYDGTAQDADKKAKKMKASKWLKDKPTKERKEKRKKERQ